jgi:FixJ family two-component response regulator
MSDSRKTVAVVDDDPSIRRALERLLRSAGYRVETFSSAREFLARKGPADPDCLVLDVSMPGQSGLDLHDSLRAAGRRIPVIFITGWSELGTNIAASDANAELLHKPLDDKALLGAVQRAIHRGLLRAAEP